MRILMVSIFSNHFFNWVEQLEDSDHEVYWFDVFDSRAEVQKISFVNQITRWRFRQDFKGRYFLKDKLPRASKWINKVNERRLTEVLEKKIIEIKPHVVQSFATYLAAAPILPVMKKFPEIKWILSTWGSDLYYYRNFPAYLEEIKNVLPKIDYLFTDCWRDHQIALENGFDGRFLGVFPGGGGYDLNAAKKYSIPYKERNTIAIKGYQGKHGKCIQVLKAILSLKEEISKYRIAVFGADEEVRTFISSTTLLDWSNFSNSGRIEHFEVMELMGKSFLFLGNSSSDGIPNTLLEAIVMGTFPIQSNPGGATAEIIEDSKNGLIIQDPESPAEIAQTILKALNDPELIREGVKFNDRHIKPGLEREKVRAQVLEKYQLMEREISNG